MDGPNASRIVGFKQMKYFKVIASLIEFVIDLHEEPKKESSIDSKCGDTFATIVADLEELVNKSKDLLSIRPALEQLTNSVETLSISIIFVGICQSIMKNKMNISSTKKTRKKKDIAANQEVNVDSLLKTYNSLLTKLKDSALRIEKILKSVKFAAIFDEKFTSEEVLVSL